MCGAWALRRESICGALRGLKVKAASVSFFIFFYFLFLPRGKGLKERESVWSLARPLEVKAASGSSFYVSICAMKAS